jgi:hypothetical protein
MHAASHPRRKPRVRPSLLEALSVRSRDRARPSSCPARSSCPSRNERPRYVSRRRIDIRPCRSRIRISTRGAGSSSLIGPENIDALGKRQRTPSHPSSTSRGPPTGAPSESVREVVDPLLARSRRLRGRTPDSVARLLERGALGRRPLPSGPVGQSRGVRAACVARERVGRAAEPRRRSAAVRAPGAGGRSRTPCARRRSRGPARSSPLSSRRTYLARLGSCVFA